MVPKPTLKNPISSELEDTHYYDILDNLDVHKTLLLVHQNEY